MVLSGMGTELQPFMRDLSVELAAYITTEEILLNESDDILHGMTMNSLPGSFFEVLPRLFVA